MNNKTEKTMNEQSELYANCRHGKYVSINSEGWLLSRTGYEAGWRDAEIFFKEELKKMDEAGR